MRIKKLQVLNICPFCKNNRFLNRLSKDGFFCHCCLNEFKVKNNKMYLIEINEYNGEMNPIALI